MAQQDESFSEQMHKDCSKARSSIFVGDNCCSEAELVVLLLLSEMSPLETEYVSGDNGEANRANEQVDNATIVATRSAGVICNLSPLVTPSRVRRTRVKTQSGTNRFHSCSHLVARGKVWRTMSKNVRSKIELPGCS